MIFLKYLFNCITWTFLFSSLLSASEDFLDYKLNVVTTPDSKISYKSVAESNIIKGYISGDITNTSYKDFNDTSVECELLGRSYKGRGFSCGFAVVEDLNGLCLLSKLNSKDILITSWSCNTTAGLSGDATCKGKVSVVEGFGKFAGVLGFGEIEMPLAKSFVDSKVSHALRLNLKIKYPLNIKKN